MNMDKNPRQDPRNPKVQRIIPAVSSVFEDGTILETVCRMREKRSGFMLFKDGQLEEKPFLDQGLIRLVPYSANNNLLKNEVVLFPEKAEEYESDQMLIDEIQGFIHRYVDVSPLFEKISAYYVLLSWIYERFRELPYLRLRGNPGCGKTRFLSTVGSICYKPIFASGASSVSPIFRILDIFRGTLIVDEGDFRFSDEKAEIVKILNNGNGKGFPVLRSEAKGTREYNPRAYTVFGPKIIATRGYFEDVALESRCITEEMGQSRMRRDIPINLPAEVTEEALQIRNKLLMFRFRNLHRSLPDEDLADPAIEPRLNQIFIPLLSIIEELRVREDLQELARKYNREMIAERGTEAEGQVLQIIYDMMTSPFYTPLLVKDITSRFGDYHGAEYERKITGKWIGNIIRKKLCLRTYKTHGNYMISSSERLKLHLLFERYGINERSDANGNQGTSDQTRDTRTGGLGDLDFSEEDYRESQQNGPI